MTEKPKYTPGQRSEMVAQVRDHAETIANRIKFRPAEYDTAKQHETLTALKAAANALELVPQLLEALKACAAVVSGEAFSKSELVRSLELAAAAIRAAEEQE